VNPKLFEIRGEPSWITEDALFSIHAAQVERFGGLHGMLDPNVVHSALARPLNRLAYDETCDMADLGAMYLIGFAGSQGFNDGNKRTGVACALVFFAINGIAVDAINAEALEETALKVANNETDETEVAMFFRMQIAGH